MLTKTPGWTASDGSFHPNLESAQKQEIVCLLAMLPGPRTPDSNSKDREVSIGEAAQQIVKESSKVIDILTTTASSKPSARRVNGGTKKRTPKIVAPVAPEKAGAA